MPWVSVSGTLVPAGTLYACEGSTFDCCWGIEFRGTSCGWSCAISIAAKANTTKDNSGVLRMNLRERREVQAYRVKRTIGNKVAVRGRFVLGRSRRLRNR